MILSALLGFPCGADAQQTPPRTDIPPVEASDPYAAFIVEAERRFGVPSSWIRAVMRAESDGNAREASPKGAMGLMQIMPDTWAELRGRYGLGADPFDAHDNILAGAAYLRDLLDRYGPDGFLAAYNAGPARYEEHVATGRPLPDETRAYVATLAPIIFGAAIDGIFSATNTAPPWTAAPLFVARESGTAGTKTPTGEPRTGGGSGDSAVRDLTALAPRSDGLFARVARRDAPP